MNPSWLRMEPEKFLTIQSPISNPLHYRLMPRGTHFRDINISISAPQTPPR